MLLAHGGEVGPLELLRSIPLFSACKDQELKVILSRVKVVNASPGNLLCEQGKRGQNFFVIVEGSAEVRRGGQTVRTMAPGDFFGEIGLLDNEPRTATVQATTKLRCLTLSRGDFYDVLSLNADLTMQVLLAVARRLRATMVLPAD